MTGFVKRLKTVFTSLPFLLSGAALLALVFFDFPVYIFLLLQFITLFLLFYIVYKKQDIRVRKGFFRLIRTGFLAGILGTAGYDIIRWLIVRLFHFTIRPFDTFKFFGQVILNYAGSETTFYGVGFAYHLLNGITFGIAYFILFNGRHWLFGILWAFVLEILMLLVYPRFLNIQSVMEEFTIVSCSGHTVYGTILGFMNAYSFKKTKIIQYGNS